VSVLQEGTIQGLEKEIEILKDRLTREERLFGLLRRERDSLRTLLQSYDEEVCAPSLDR
jgi:hypothetical protein